MPSNERQNARKENKQKAQQRTKKIIWFIIIFVSVALIAMRVAEIDFSALKSKYFDKDGKISVSVDVNSNMFP